MRQFAAGSGVLAFTDVPWASVYLGAISLLHPLLGAFALAVALVPIPILLAISLLQRLVLHWHPSNRRTAG